MSITRVAKLVGVSSSTVSRVINNHPRVAPETADSVRRAMQEIGWTPSERRPGPKPLLRTQAGASSIAFFMLGNTQRRATPAFEAMLHGVSAAAERHRLNLNFRHVRDAEDLKTRIVGGKIDGVLLHGALPNLNQMSEIRRLPTVWLMGNRNRSEWGDQVMPNHYECGCLAAKHLMRRGHRKLAYLNLDRGHWGMHLYGHSFGNTAEQAGAQAVVLEQERELAGGYWHEFSAASVDAMVRQFLALPDRPTGIYIAEDMQVAVLQPALQRAGVNIGPGGVEVVSTNNEQPYLLGLSPKPTEIDIRPESVGHRGVEQLLWRIMNPSVPEHITTMIEPVLIDLAVPATN